jgi:hypothetical protein
LLAADAELYQAGNEVHAFTYLDPIEDALTSAF